MFEILLPLANKRGEVDFVAAKARSLPFPALVSIVWLDLTASSPHAPATGVRVGIVLLGGPRLANDKLCTLLDVLGFLLEGFVRDRASHIRSRLILRLTFAGLLKNSTFVSPVIEAAVIVAILVVSRWEDTRLPAEFLHDPLRLLPLSRVRPICAREHSDLLRRSATDSCCRIIEQMIQRERLHGTDMLLLQR